MAQCERTTGVYPRLPGSYTAALDAAAMSSHRITRTTGLALAMAALAAPSALASNTPQSLVSPDAQDAAGGRGSLQSLVSPDAQDAAGGRGSWQSLVSPDAQDAAAGRSTYSAPEVTVVKVPAVATDNGSDGGIQWTDAAVGAGGMLGIILLAGGTAALVTHRPRRRATAAHRTAH